MNYTRDCKTEKGLHMKSIENLTKKWKEVTLSCLKDFVNESQGMYVKQMYPILRHLSSVFNRKKHIIDK